MSDNIKHVVITAIVGFVLAATVLGIVHLTAPMRESDSVYRIECLERGGIVQVGQCVQTLGTPGGDR